MILNYIHADNSKEIINIAQNRKITDKWINIDSVSKTKFVKEFIPAFNSGQKIVLFDKNHKQLLQFHQNNNLNSLENMQNVNKNSQILFFTSGSSGFPIGAFKSRDNLIREVEVLKNLLDDYVIKRVVVTVPFVHIYGIIAGLLLPQSLGDIELIIKDDFLPYDLLDEASIEDTLIITTPVFIKALARLDIYKELKSTLFISSTAPLHTDDIIQFKSRYKTDILQLFGSTETGGIAYKYNEQESWKNLDFVDISSKDDKLNISSPFISKYIFDKKIHVLAQPFESEDIIEIKENRFKLIGRSNKLIKIAGKRISALQIESILEDIPEIKSAIVELVYKKDLLRSEQIKITLKASKEVKKSIIKKSISNFFGTLTIPFSVKYVDEINYSAVGKKVIF